MRKEEKKLLGVSLFLGIFLRLLTSWRKDFWYDEAFTWVIAKQPVSQMLRAITADNNPPFYYLFLHFWLKISQAEFFLRLPSLFFNLLALFFVWKIGRQLFNRRVALTASLIFLLSPLQVYFSAEARMYSLWTMFTCAGFYFFLKILKNQSPINYLLFALCYLLSFYTHYFTLFFLLALDIFLICTKKYRHLLFKVFLCQATIGLLLIPWLALFFSSPHPRPWEITPIIGIPATFLSFVLGGMGAVTLKTFFSSSVPILIRAIFILTSIFFIFLFFLGAVSRQRKNERLLLLILIFFPILAVTLVSFVYPAYSPRSLIVFSPAFYFLVSLGLVSLTKILKFWPRILAAGLLVLIILIQNFYPSFKPDSLSQAIKSFTKISNSQDSVAHTSILTYYSFQYYLPQYKNQYLILPSGLPRQTTDIIGGTPNPISEIISIKRRICLIVDMNGTNLSDLSSIQKELADLWPISAVSLDRFQIFLYSPSLPL